MHGIRAILVLVTVGVQYSAAACPDADAALAEVKTCLEGKLTTITSEAYTVCETETTMNGHVSPCAAPVADCPDADKQTGKQHVADAELKIAEKCGVYEKQKLCDKERQKCATSFSTQLDFIGSLVRGDYNATQQEEQCTSVTNHVMGCFDDFECCPHLTTQLQVSLLENVPISVCPKMQNALEEHCSKDTDKTSKASQMTTSMLVLSGTLLLWAF